MAVQLIFNKYDAPETDAVVTFKRQTFFGPRAGTVDVSGRNPIRIRAVSYGWKRETEELLEKVPQCYREILQEAAARNCRSIALPLASVKEPGFPRYWDYTMAMDQIRDFTAAHEMDVYLVMNRMAPPDNEKIQADMDKFLEKMLRELEHYRVERPNRQEEFTVQESQFSDDPDEEIEREVVREFKVFENSRPVCAALDDDEEDEEDIKILYNPETVEEILTDADSADADELEMPPLPKLFWADEDAIPVFPELDEEENLWDASPWDEPVQAPSANQMFGEETPKPKSLFWGGDTADESRKEAMKAAPPAPRPSIAKVVPPAPRPSIVKTAPTARAVPAPKGLSEMGLGECPFNEELTEFLKCADVGFTDCLLACIDATGKKDSEIYTKAHISRQLFSKIRNDPNYRPTKQTALAFAIALELNMDQTQDLIGRAGYVLNNNNTFDMIVTFFITRKCYDLTDVNFALAKFDQKLLGA